ncbi:MAG: hypothetical protein Q8O88_05185 [bacterium]|nr:hypothetical protein [bacterium]
MQKLSKFLAFFLLLFLFPVSVNAQVPGLKFPCDDTADPEFHSLRPYQAAPCGDAVKALYCSNDLIFTEDFDMTNKGGCTPKYETGSFPCDPQYYVGPHNLYVQLDDSFLPIMGNTEDEFDDAQKVNEYASWYLSGVNNRAEYGENTDERVVNFSGPVQKLLPKMIQEAERIETIKKATLNDTEWTDEDTGETFNTPQNHDQIVVCVNGNNAVPCPEGSGLRLSNWGEGSLSAINTFFNWLGTDIWNHKYPPLPWQFDKQILYQKAYSEWQGKNCAILPIIGLQCLDTPVSDKWADLYQYIPLSNTTDKKGAEYIKDKPQYIPSPGTEIGPVSTGKIKIPPLYFAHMQEVKDLSELLNKSYTPKDVESVPLPETTEDNNCSVATVRTNKGDDLFPGDENELLIPNVEYDITQATCNEVYEEKIVPCNTPLNKPSKNKCVEIIHTFDCPAQVVIKIPTGTKSPWANEIFSTTVADSGSTFRKIFPKVEEGAPVSCIADIPTITDVTYDPDIGGKSQKPRGGDLNFGVYRYPEDGAGDSPQLTFPHIGSVYEYFLKGIQTALRPKGYGEPITDGTLCQQPETGTGACKQWLFEKDKGGKFYYDKIIQAANATSCNGKKLNPFWAIGIALNENGGLMTDDLKGLSKSHFGCNISALQTIEDKISCMTNTLRNDCLAGKTDEQALQEYGYLPGYELWPITVLDPGGSYPPPLFGSGFNVNQLTTNLLNINWVDAYKAKAPIFCPSSPILEPSTN